MSYIKDVFGQDLYRDFGKYYVGFDDTVKKLTNIHDEIVKTAANYPPYNIKQTGENTYVIEIAAAGFGKQDIEITLDGGKMAVTGKITTPDPDTSFLHRGIANRAFTRTFVLNDFIEIKDADMWNGMLRIFLERIIPDHKKPKKIEIKDAVAGKAAKTGKQILTEDPEGRDL